MASSQGAYNSLDCIWFFALCEVWWVFFSAKQEFLNC